MDDEYLKQLAIKAEQNRIKNAEKLKRRIEMGYIKGKIYPNDMEYQTSAKGIQNWYDTKTLVRLVTEAFDRNEKVDGRRVCYINGKWRLQIRGKHLRRLLKAMPNVKQIGRMLVEEK
jgi:hypothetical protein